MKKVVEVKMSAEQLVAVLKQLSENQQVYINGYVQALADTKQTA